MKYMKGSGHRKLLCAVLIIGVVLPLVAQAKMNTMTLTALTSDHYLSGDNCQNCQKSGCACPRCHPGNLGQKSCCRYIPVNSLPGLPSDYAVTPELPESSHYLALIVLPSRIIISDIFHPPKSCLSPASLT